MGRLRNLTSTGWLAVLLALGGTPVQAQFMGEPPTLRDRPLLELVSGLKGGGYVIYFRHLPTRQDEEDRNPVDLNDCAGQRNLSEEGKSHGRSIAGAFKRARIPVKTVLASPFCRAVDSAKIVFGRATTDFDLFFAMALTNAGKQQKGAALRRLLSQVPAAGTNTVIVGHTANLQEAVGLWPKPEGVAYVFRPDGKGAFSAVGRVDPDAWAAAVR